MVRTIQATLSWEKDKMKSFIDLRVVGNSPEIGEFLKMCQLIQSFGTYGTCRKITVTTDGDGSGRLRFGLVGENGKIEDIPSIPHNILNQSEFDLSIGE